MRQFLKRTHLMYIVNLSLLINVWKCVYYGLLCLHRFNPSSLLISNLSHSWGTMSVGGCVCASVCVFLFLPPHEIFSDIVSYLVWTSSPYGEQSLVIMRQNVFRVMEVIFMNKNSHSCIPGHYGGVIVSQYYSTGSFSSSELILLCTSS